MKVYAAKHKDIDVRLHSSSGGIFTALAEAILDQEGIVIGAGWNGIKCEHMCVDNKADLYKLRGSKYVVSTIPKEVVSTVRNNRTAPMLWSGTPCQMLPKRDNLYQVDVICHGTPTVKSFNEYCEKNNITKINFRDKIHGWTNFNITINGDKTSPFQHNEFMNTFLKNRNLNKKCYQCQFKNMNSNSDIQIGDFWGIQNEYPKFADNIGVSVVIIKTAKGQQLWNMIKDKVEYIPVEINKVIKYNPSLIKSAERM